MAAPGPDGRPGIRVVHVMTVPVSLAFLRGQAAFMAARGIRLEAITSPGPELEAWGRREGVPVHAVEMPRRISPLRDLVAVWRLVRLLRRLRPDVVHAHTPKGGLLGTIAARLAGVPACLYHVRGLPYVTASGWRRTLLQNTERISCGLAHRVLAVSRSMLGLAVRDGVCPAWKIGVPCGGSGNGVDATGRFQPQPREVGAAVRAGQGIPPGALVVGFVGRLVQDKGIGELAAAWATLREAVPGVHLVLVGPEEARDAVDPRVLAGLRADPRVHLVGPVAEPVRWYAAMDVVALPTYREGFPNVALEAAAMGLPIVATDVPGCTDAVIHGSTGLLVPAGSAPELAAALLRYLGDAALRTAHGQAARARVLAEFRQEAIWADLASEYAALSGGGVATTARP